MEKLLQEQYGLYINGKWVPASDGATFTAVVSCIGNIGPGLDAVGPTSNFSALSSLSKAVLSVLMLTGRLEIFPILVLLNPHGWMHK